MLHVYFCPIEERNGTTFIVGEGVIHDAVIEPGATAYISKVIMDTTTFEHEVLVATAISHRPPTVDEINAWNEDFPPYTPDPATLRAEELLAQSPPTITMPEIWELLRIFGRRLGYNFQ